MNEYTLLLSDCSNSSTSALVKTLSSYACTRTRTHEPRELDEATYTRACLGGRVRQPTYFLDNARLALAVGHGTARSEMNRSALVARACERAISLPTQRLVLVLDELDVDLLATGPRTSRARRTRSSRRDIGFRRRLWLLLLLLRWRRRLWIVHRAQAGSRSRESGGDSLTLTHTHSLSRQGGDGACECCVWLLDASRVRWRAALLALWLGDFSVREWFSRFSVGATGATVVRALFDFFRSPPPPHRFVPRMNCTDRNRSIS